MGRNTQTVLKQQQLILMGQDKRWAQFRVKPFSFPSNRLTGKTMVNGEKKKKKKRKKEKKIVCLSCQFRLLVLARVWKCHASRYN